MRQAIFQAMIKQLPTSNSVTSPSKTGHTIYYRTRPAFDSVRYLKLRNRLTGYIKVRNLQKHGINAQQLIGPSALTAKGDIKLASLSDVQLTKLMELIIKLASC